MSSASLMRKRVKSVILYKNSDSVLHYITRVVIPIPNPITKASIMRPIQKRLSISFLRIQRSLSSSRFSSISTGRPVVEYFKPAQAAVPSAADTARQRLHKSVPASAAQHHCSLLCWQKRRNTKAAGCCCCCSTAVGSAVARSKAAECFAEGCRSLRRGLEACGREPSLCRGRVGNRASCGGGRLRILRDVSELFLVGVDGVGWLTGLTRRGRRRRGFPG